MNEVKARLKQAKSFGELSLNTLDLNHATDSSSEIRECLSTVEKPLKSLTVTPPKDWDCPRKKWRYKFRPRHRIFFIYKGFCTTNQ